MIALSTQIDVTAAQDYLARVRDEQLPFATSLAINNIAKKAQAGQQHGMQESFTIRRPWVLDQIKISHFSHKDDDPMYARIQVGKNADFLNKFEAGGWKTSRTGRNLAIPIMARAGRGAIVPDSLRPKALNLHLVGKSIRGDQRTFMATLKSGRQGIFQRIGSGRGDVQLLYELVPGATVPPSLRFVSTACSIVETGWQAEWEAAMELALRTAK